MATSKTLWLRYVEGGVVGCASCWWEWIEVVKSLRGFRLRAGTSHPYELRFSHAEIRTARDFVRIFEECVDECFSDHVWSETELPSVESVLGGMEELDSDFSRQVSEAIQNRDSEEEDEEVLSPTMKPGVIIFHGFPDFEKKTRPPTI